MNIYEETELFYGSFTGEKRIYGTSAEGRPLFAIFLGKHEHPIGISQYAIHGREWVTALLAFEHAKTEPARGGIWLLPLTNPDGACLSQEGLQAVSRGRWNFLLAVNGGARDFSLWKANAEGVDLNVNFDARWGTGKRNVFSPAPEGYVGERPFCAPETAALKRFTEEVSPDYTVSWHTKGEEIYWQFHEPLPQRLRAKRLARRLRGSTGYPLKKARGSAGGYKDWCIEKLGIPAFTVEAGRDSLSHPLTERDFKEIAARCGGALRALSEEA